MASISPDLNLRAAIPIKKGMAAIIALGPHHGCRVGAGIAPGAPHGPVRDQFGHTVRQ